MSRRRSRYLNSTAGLKAENAELRAALSEAQTSKEPSVEQMKEIDINFKRAWRRQVRRQRAIEEERKREKLLKMTDYAP